MIDKRQCPQCRATCPPGELKRPSGSHGHAHDPKAKHARSCPHCGHIAELAEFRHIVSREPQVERAAFFTN